MNSPVDYRSPYADLGASVAPPRPDYRRTQTSRSTWDVVPAATIATLEAQLGATMAHAGPPSTMGFTDSYAGPVQLSDGRRVFLKAALASQPFPYEGIQRETEVLASLPERFPACQVMAATSDDAVAALALDHIVGHTPGLPWTPEDAAIVLRALEDMQRRATDINPAVIHGVTTERYANNPAYAAGLALLEGTSRTLPPWLPHRDRASEIAELARRSTTLWNDDGVCHHDLRPDNLLIDHETGRAVLLDWNWVMRGPRWFDAAGLLPGLHADGFDTRLWLASPLFRGVHTDALDSMYALLIAYFLDSMRQEIWPGCDAGVRHHQAWYAHLFATYLGHRRGWPSP